MNTLKYALRIIVAIFALLFRRLIGKKKNPNWDLKTELIWKTTRLTILSSNRYGLVWFKGLSRNYKPKPQLKDQVEIKENETETGSYLHIKPKEIDNNKIIIYFHGGGYVTGSPNANIEFTTKLASQSESELIVPFYPTAPEQTYPAAHQFSLSFIQNILNDFGNKEIYIAGDSAGAGLVLSSIINLNNSDFDKIKGCILISPWVEPLSTVGTIQTNVMNDVGDKDFLFACYHAYMNNKKVIEQYPLTFDQTNLKKLPKTLLTVGSGEMLVDQTNRLNENLQYLRTKTELLTYDTMFHTFWNLTPQLKEADKLIEDIGNWIKNNR